MGEERCCHHLLPFHFLSHFFSCIVMLILLSLYLCLHLKQDSIRMSWGFQKGGNGRGESSTGFLRSGAGRENFGMASHRRNKNFTLTGKQKDALSDGAPQHSRFMLRCITVLFIVWENSCDNVSYSLRSSLMAYIKL